jgi:formiminoglutamase
MAFPDQSIGCINMDAHFDLRPKINGKITSGSPFRILIDEKILDPKRLVEFGIQKQSNHPDLFDFAKRTGVKTVLLSELISSDPFQSFVQEYQRLEKISDIILISLDLDVFPQSAAPGVSAPQAEGLPVSEVFKMLAWSAKQEKTKGLGIFELNPMVDVQECTARLAATAAYRFVSAAIESE